MTRDKKSIIKFKHEYLLMALGLSPFVFSVILITFGVDELFSIINTKKIAALYSLVIVSFMAGVVWGINLPIASPEMIQKSTPYSLGSNKFFYISNILTLLVWLTYLAAPDSKTFFTASLLCFLYFLLIDRQFYNVGIIKKNYLRLRVLVTTVVSMCLLSIIFSIS